MDEKGKAPLRAEDIEAAEEADAEDDDADDEDDAKEGDAGDMQVRCPQDASCCPSSMLLSIKIIPSNLMGTFLLARWLPSATSEACDAQCCKEVCAMLAARMGDAGGRPLHLQQNGR